MNESWNHFDPGKDESFNPLDYNTSCEQQENKSSKQLIRKEM